jgi:hypothetical protein
MAYIVKLNVSYFRLRKDVYGICYDVKFTVCLLTVQCASCICMERYANVLYFVGG